jgi:hypothetical protein
LEAERKKERDMEKKKEMGKKKTKDMEKKKKPPSEVTKMKKTKTNKPPSQVRHEKTTHQKTTVIHHQKTTVTHPVTGVVQDVFLPVGKLELMTSVFTNNQNAQMRRIGGYFFIANGRSCASSFEVRGMAFDWEQEYAYYCKVQFSMVFMVSEDGDEFLDDYQSMSTEVAKELLPDLMRCLPDWSEIEQRLPGNDAQADNENSQSQAS